MLVMIFNVVQELSTSKGSTQSARPRAYMFGTNDNYHLHTPSLAQKFPSFDDWLSTWTASGEDQDGSAASVSGGSVNLLPSAASAESTDHSTVKLVIEGLKIGSPSTWATKEIIAPRHTPLYEVTSFLNSHGYEYVCGFSNAVDGTNFPPFLPWNTSLVVITDGSSSYDVEAGLRINQRESLVEFYNGCFRKVAVSNSSASLSVEKRGSTLTIQDEVDPRITSSITFQRTLRLPEDRKLHGTSEFLGPFPLFSTDEHASRLPPAMNSKGGMFFPMFQREGLAISLSSEDDHARTRSHEIDPDRFAVKVYAGSINCLSGRKASETDDEPRTNYIVCPRQRRLDGYQSADGSIRQFVAMPLGWGYSAEHQVTGHEFVGGIQLNIASRLRDHVEFRSLDELWHFGRALRRKSTPEDLGFKVGDVLAMTDFDPAIKVLDDSKPNSTYCPEEPLLSPMDNNDHRASTIQDILQKTNRRAEEVGDSVRLRTVNPVLVHLKVFIDGRIEFEESLPCSPYLGLGSLASQRLHCYHLDCGHCNKCTMGSKYGICPEWAFQSEPSSSNSWRAWPAQHCPLSSLPASYTLKNGQLRFDPDWQMALGAGARLLQQIHKSSSHQCWDWRNSRFINVQILNAVAFQSVTGIPPWTPVSLKDYREKRLSLQVPLSPLQNDYPETSPEPTMPELSGISALDRETPYQVRDKRLMVLCPQCEINMCNIA
ncbi:hypothetical protein LY76DRAFT_510164 [Colletotrichum caudatum]|nr:hypothetical protein LY76DRAFT_510164 [Colletotrichum caudatum]